MVDAELRWCLDTSLHAGAHLCLVSQTARHQTFNTTSAILFLSLIDLEIRLYNLFKPYCLQLVLFIRGGEVNIYFFSQPSKLCDHIRTNSALICHHRRYDDCQMLQLLRLTIFTDLDCLELAGNLRWERRGNNRNVLIKI
jgi:hypothetical protein